MNQQIPLQKLSQATIEDVLQKSEARDGAGASDKARKSTVKLHLLNPLPIPKQAVMAISMA